ncbi:MULTISPECIES: bacteriocin immunity protein [Vibrio]|uniref:bacteriocin immunity protein n=1 Tax=Vibrio TaxID=662 RepID=UPI0028FC3108|nr:MULTISPECIES: bacteriocin immunity protein [Vibrio]MDW1552955.1 bacteriocin immunity protein [Vibrio sp. YT-18]WNW05099.1 bacteriocin immunity protein [Vibrio alginolyticus]
MNIGKLSKEQLIELANRFLDAESEEESSYLYDEFNKQFSHPDAANLFFYPENYNARKMSLSDYAPTVEEVIEIALQHKPIQL